ncbi:MAG: hypothetical protein ABI641_13955 [Caldimonas sp.]
MAPPPRPADTRRNDRLPVSSFYEASAIDGATRWVEYCVSGMTGSVKE